MKLGSEAGDTAALIRSYVCDHCRPQSYFGRFNFLERLLHFSFSLLFRELCFSLSGMREFFGMIGSFIHRGALYNRHCACTTLLHHRCQEACRVFVPAGRAWKELVGRLGKPFTLQGSDVILVQLHAVHF